MTDPIAAALAQSAKPLGDMRPAERLAHLGRHPAAALPLLQPRPAQPPQPQPQPQMSAADMLIGQVMQTAFAGGREARSACYLVGVRAALQRHLLGTQVVCRWVPGTAERYAFFAGVDEGNALWRQHGAEMQAVQHCQGGAA